LGHRLLSQGELESRSGGLSNRLLGSDFSNRLLAGLAGKMLETLAEGLVVVVEGVDLCAHAVLELVELLVNARNRLSKGQLSISYSLEEGKHVVGVLMMGSGRSRLWLGGSHGASSQGGLGL